MRTERNPQRPTGRRVTPDNGVNGDAAPRATNEPAPGTGSSANGGQEKLDDRATWKQLLHQFAELHEHASCYASARIDSARASVRSAITRLLLAALAFVAVGGLVVMSSWLALSGLAQGLGAYFVDRPWMGSLLTGLAALVATGAGVFGVCLARRRNARQRTVEKYENREARQRTRFGRDAQGQPAPAVARSE